MRCIALAVALFSIFLVVSNAQELEVPDAPSSVLSYAALRATIPTSNAAYRSRQAAIESGRVVDREFMVLSAVSTATIFMDSYTTTWIGANYRARHYGACTVEGGEPALYGLHPTVARTYAAAAGLNAGAIAVSYLAKKHLPSKINWMWRSPILFETVISVRGFATNLARCNP